MSTILVLSWSKYGHTDAIADRLALRLEDRGLGTVRARVGADKAIDLERFDGVVVCAALYSGSHGRQLERLVRRHRAELTALPTAFVSVSLSASEPLGSLNRAGVLNAVDRFCGRAGWRPGRIDLIGGKLAYTRYNPLIRMVMRRIARAEGRPTDTARDYDLTDWAAVDRLGRELFPQLTERRAPPPPEEGPRAPS